jgi:hypothetical protein
MAPTEMKVVWTRLCSDRPASATPETVSCRWSALVKPMRIHGRRLDRHEHRDEVRGTVQ